MENQQKTGTTTLGMVCKDCVIIAAESKVTMGYLITSKEFPKVYQIDDRMAMTISGGVGDAQNIIRVLKAEIAYFHIEFFLGGQASPGQITAPGNK